jgi:hypothetical protein
VATGGKTDGGGEPQRLRLNQAQRLEDQLVKRIEHYGDTDCRQKYTHWRGTLGIAS